MIRATGQLGSPFLLALLVGLAVSRPACLHAGEMLQDPNGFDGFTWGASLDAAPTLKRVESGPHVTSYVFRDQSPSFGGAAVQAHRLDTYDGGFARVFIRYRGQKNHDLLVAYLESKFGPIERMPGAMVRGLNQQYNWRGPETEVNLIYRSHGELGTIYIESRVLAPRFNDVLPEHGY